MTKKNQTDINIKLLHNYTPASTLTTKNEILKPHRKQ